MADIPPPPPGFTLDTGNVPPPPEGFTLDNPQKTPSGFPMGKEPDPRQPGESNADYLRRTTLAGNMLTGAQESGVNIMQGARWVGEKLYGKDPHDEAEKSAFEAANKNLEAKEGSGVGNFAARMAGDPLNYIGGAAVKEGELVQKGASKVASAFEKKPPIPESGEIKLDSQKAYDWFEKQGGSFTPKFTDKFLEEVDKIVPQTQEGKIFAGNNEITALVNRAQKLRGEGGRVDPYGITSTKASMPITFKGMEEIDKELTSQVSRHFQNGQLDEQGKQIMAFQDKFRDLIDKASGDHIAGGKEALEGYKYARAKWAQAARMRDVEHIMTRAQMMDNPATALKTGFRTLYNNKSRIAGYTAEEKEAIKLAAEGKYTDVLRTFGSRLIPIATAVKGGGLVGDAGAYAASAANRKAAELLQMKRANDVRRAIGSRKITGPADLAIGAETDPLAAGVKQ